MKALSLNSSHAEADRHKPHWMTHSTLCLPIPEQFWVPAAERSSPVRSHPPQRPQRDRSTRPCNYCEFPGRKEQLNACKNPPAQGGVSLKGLILLQHAADHPALLRKDAAQHLKGATSHLGSFSPITGSGQCCAACEHKNIHNKENWYYQRSCSSWREHHNWVLQVPQSREGTESKNETHHTSKIKVN